MEPIEWGRIAYEAYGEYRGWTTWRREKMPSWDEQSAELKDAWTIAARAVIAEVIRDAARAVIAEVVSDAATAVIAEVVNTPIWASEKRFHPCEMPKEHPAYMDKEHCPACRIESK